MESNGGCCNSNAAMSMAVSPLYGQCVVLLKTGEREDRYESAIADLKARLKNVSNSGSFCT